MDGTSPIEISRPETVSDMLSTETPGPLEERLATFMDETVAPDTWASMPCMSIVRFW